MISILLDNFKNTAYHFLLRQNCIQRNNFIIFVAMPYLYYVLSIDPDAIFVNWKVSVPPGKALEAVQALMMKVKNIRERDVCNILECERHSLEIELAYNKDR